MDGMGMKELFEEMRSELFEKAKGIEKVGDMKEIDKPIVQYVEMSDERKAMCMENQNNTANTDGLLDDGDDDLIEEADKTESVSGCPIDGHGGSWEGMRGNSMWYPERSEIPKNPKTNPDGLTWGQILDKYDIEGIPFKDGEPDFSDVSKGSVEIDNFTENRYGKGGNFDQACEKLAEQRGCTKEEVKEWMKENKYTWHEQSDCQTMEKVPTEVHGNVRHEGGISEMKNNEGQTIEKKEAS